MSARMRGVEGTGVRAAAAQDADVQEADVQEAAVPDADVQDGSGPDGSGLDYPALYRQHWRPLLRLAQSLVDDVASAEDVVQDAFAALVARQSRLRDPAAAGAYLQTCVVNGARSALRRRRTVRTKLALIDETRDEPGADERTLLTAEHEQVRATLARLPRRQREVLGLRLLCDLTDREIAGVTGMSHATVRSSASRGLATLRAALQATAPDASPNPEGRS